MALTPQNEDAFFREVDEDLRRDRFAGMARQWGPVAVTVLLVALVLLAGGLWWRSHRAYQAGLVSEALAQPLDQIGNGQPLSDPAALQKIAASPRPGYQAIARLAIAADAVRKGDAKAAAADYGALANDDDVAQPIRDLAQVRMVALQYDTLPPQGVIDRLKAITVPGNAYFASAAEMTANAFLALGRKDRAGALFAAIVRDADAPASIRGRASGMATSLGQAVAPVAGAATLKE
ncbi:tetratricopeptide repeat protein [Sphingomonas bacterium]|uniref:tetratricopeptide repeat protein n=1 Tax=Sphingomonas bacterium TaxID=1895847 RepID=UPI001576974D|nr:tetratricopeptide repeat protein [Sphingomonas bacterium]